jgi:hypothetical protein
MMSGMTGSTSWASPGMMEAPESFDVNQIYSYHAKTGFTPGATSAPPQIRHMSSDSSTAARLATETVQTPGVHWPVGPPSAPYGAGTPFSAPTEQSYSNAFLNLSTPEDTSTWHQPAFTNDGLQLPTGTDGPERAVESPQNVFGYYVHGQGGDNGHAGGATTGSGTHGQGSFDSNMDTTFDPSMQTDLDQSVPLDPEEQARILVDLFWPGWPRNLPEPSVVNDL